MSYHFSFKKIQIKGIMYFILKVIYMVPNKLQYTVQYMKHPLQSVLRCVQNTKNVM
jgi:hypothetical protein